MSTETENRNHLAGASSAYLRQAQQQLVKWWPWGQEAFDEAQRLSKPVLLDIGATWCHWCRVMDRESYRNPETAALIESFFVPVKVDRDEHPEIDARYQAAVSAISGQAGWPLTVFLTPEGEPYFGGSYFAAEERYGRPAFAHVLRSMAAAYTHQRAEVEESAASVVEAIEQSETFAERGTTLDELLLERMTGAMLAQYDARHGGFGSQPKFPYASALDLLIDVSAQPGPHAARAREVVEGTLRRMAMGGVQDQLAGGFHRYSVDEGWIVPRFEKLSYDNAALLRVYTKAFQLWGDPSFREAAHGIVQWMDRTLAERELGGFYASQRADAGIEDEGALYTWTRAEAEAVLSPMEFAVAERRFHLRAVGHMHANPAKNVLCVLQAEAGIGNALGLVTSEVQSLLAAAKSKLLTARMRRPEPPIDRTVYSGWNGLCVSAYLAAGRTLDLPEATAFALTTLDRVLTTAWSETAGLTRVVAYGENDGGSRPVPAVLEDYVFVAVAALDAWEISNQERYRTTAQQMTERLLVRFYDEAEGGFFDMDQRAEGAPLGALRAKRKPVQDAPTPAGNSLAATLLLRLWTVTGEPRYRVAAEQTLKLFAGLAEHLGLYAASYGQALRLLLAQPER